MNNHYSFILINNELKDTIFLLLNAINNQVISCILSPKTGDKTMKCFHVIYSYFIRWQCYIQKQVYYSFIHIFYICQEKQFILLSMINYICVYRRWNVQVLHLEGYIKC